MLGPATCTQFNCLAFSLRSKLWCLCLKPFAIWHEIQPFLRRQFNHVRWTSGNILSLIDVVSKSQGIRIYHLYQCLSSSFAMFGKFAYLGHIVGRWSNFRWFEPPILKQKGFFAIIFWGGNAGQNVQLKYKSVNSICNNFEEKRVSWIWSCAAIAPAAAHNSKLRQNHKNVKFAQPKKRL